MRDRATGFFQMGKLQVHFPAACRYGPCKCFPAPPDRAKVSLATGKIRSSASNNAAPRRDPHVGEMDTTCRPSAVHRPHAGARGNPGQFNHSEDTGCPSCDLGQRRPQQRRNVQPSVTPASAKVAMPLWQATAPFSTWIANAAPDASPSRSPRESSGSLPSFSSNAACAPSAL